MVYSSTVTLRYCLQSHLSLTLRCALYRKHRSSSAAVKQENSWRTLDQGSGLMRRTFRQEKPQRFAEPSSLTNDYAHIWKLCHAPQHEYSTDSTEICHVVESISYAPKRCAEILETGKYSSHSAKVWPNC